MVSVPPFCTMRGQLIVREEIAHPSRVFVAQLMDLEEQGGPLSVPREALALVD